MRIEVRDGRFWDPVAGVAIAPAEVELDLERARAQLVRIKERQPDAFATEAARVLEDRIAAMEALWRTGRPTSGR